MPNIVSTSKQSLNKKLPSLPQLQLPARNDSSFAQSLNKKLRSLNSDQYLALVPLKVDRNLVYTIGLGMNPCPTCVNGTRLTPRRWLCSAKLRTKYYLPAARWKASNGDDRGRDTSEQREGELGDDNDAVGAAVVKPVAAVAAGCCGGGMRWLRDWGLRWLLWFSEKRGEEMRLWLCEEEEQMGAAFDLGFTASVLPFCEMKDLKMKADMV
ncbi:hypothetical protein Ahy_A05g024861 isoform A [Arachis hypogaea]|uniref:Uncharacterized protein n=1 Tax=Arachis hypogaea TaxID=3818 RepID=A0A445D6X1_ARAHY|nr:hypothetical protein Ahy_A05g024861 isoform A [Arachis hypogaea]